MSLPGPKAKKLGTLRWSADQGQTGRVPQHPRPPVVTRFGHACRVGTALSNCYLRATQDVTQVRERASGSFTAIPSSALFSKK
jgi:hypothetical protein